MTGAAPRFTQDYLAWLRECHPEGAHCPTDAADIFVTDLGIVAVENDGTTGGMFCAPMTAKNW